MEYGVVEYAGGAGNGALQMKNAHPYVSHCTIRNNQASGIYAWDLSGTLKITHSTLSDNTASAGGGIYVSGGTHSISNNTISRNTASGSGGGIYVGSGTSTISDNTINNNTALASGGHSGGGGIYTASGTSLISNNTISDNSAASGGGGIITSGTSTISYNTISNNTASHGGGISVADRCTATISCNVISNNTASEYAGGIIVNGLGTAIISNNVIRNNATTSATSKGGGIYHSGRGSISNNDISNNTVSEYGGGIYVEFGGPEVISNNDISDNIASNEGGGIFIDNRPVAISNNTISNNIAQYASAVRLYCSNSRDFKYNTITGNQATGSTPTYTVYVKNDPLINYNNIFGNTAIYELWNDNAQGSDDVNAENNWWGTAAESEVQAGIYDWFDDSAKGIVDYAPYETSIRTDAPISPPTGLTATGGTESITLAWSANPESDVAGYKVYWDTDSGYPYTNVVDVGKGTSYTLTGLGPGEYYVTVTAYDRDYAESNDDLDTIVNDNQTHGNESWYAKEPTVQTGGMPPDISLSATSLNFGDVQVGATASRSLVVSNTGGSDLSVSDVSSSDPQFTGSSPSFTAAAGGSQNVTVTFRPTSAGSKAATLTITSDDPDESTLQVSLSGNGVSATSGQFTRITEGDMVNDGGNSYPSSWGDFDNDGDLDLFVGNFEGENNFLYSNNGDGTFTKITEGAIVTDRGNSHSGSWGDYDNDGDLDLFVANYWGENNSLYRNNGNGTFTKITSGEIVTDGGSSIASSWGDYDNDGNLDLFVANKGGNFLYSNNGDGTFTKITSGEIVTDGGNSFGSSWGDYDSDGDLDLFVANLAQQNNFLYRNNGDGTFTKITTGEIVTDGGHSIGSSWGDYDNDGDLDLFVPNQENQNFLYRNNGDGTFTKITIGEIVTDGGHSIGSSWGDYDNDGDLDLFVANGGIYGSSQNNFLYRNDGDGTFTKITTGEIVNDGGNSCNSSWGDYDHDGDLDLFVTNYHRQNNFLYANNGNSNRWINVKCVGTVSNTSAIGAKVRVKATIHGTPVWQVREISGQTGCMSQNSLNAEFGLGDAAIIDSVRIEWPSGIVQVFTHVPVNQFLTITESEVDVTPPAAPQNLTASPGNQQVTLTWSPNTELDLSYYVIYRSTTSGFTPQSSDSVGRVDKLDTTFTDVGLMDAMTYYYRVSAVDNVGNESRYSAEVSAPLGQFTRITEGAIVNDGGNSFSSGWVDFDNDGDLDLFVSKENNFLYSNNGDGTFTKITEGAIVTEGGSHGNSWGDYDNDGNLDLFVSNWGQNNFLYRNNGNGTFTKITSGEIVTDGGSSRVCSWGDYDNDGDLDLFVANWGDNFLYSNNGDGTFTKITSGEIVTDGGNSTGSSWGDYDNDGDLDLFVADYGQSNFLYRNNGDGTFTKITTGEIVNDGGYSNGCSWGDYDNDGDLDLFVANDDQNNFLYRNNGDGTFTKITTGEIVNDGGYSHGSSWGDYDNDGDLDLFVANGGPLGRSQNNFLYRNNSDGTFTKVTTGEIVNDGGNSGSSSWGDYDHDGDSDLFVPNHQGQNDFLYANNGNSNGWINITCVGTVSNTSAIGAKVRVKATINGTPVWQMQEISGQTGYGSQNSLNAEFGLGDAAMIDSVKIEWPSGMVQVLTDVATNQFLEVVESVGVTVSVPNTTASPGAPLTIPINVDNATGIAGAEFVVTYNPDILAALGAQTTDLTSEFALADSVSDGKIAISLASNTGIPSGSGSLVDITFQVIGAPGDTTSIVLKYVALYDESLSPIEVTTKDGLFRVNQPPIAYAGPDTVKVTDVDGNGVEVVVLDGSGSTDPDGPIEAYEWTEDATVLGTDVSISPSLSVGDHVVTLTVTDNIGATDTDTVVVIVQVGLDSIKISPDSAIVEVGKPQQFTARGFDAAGNPVEIAPTWSVVPSEIGEIGSDGVFTAAAWGKGKVIATQGGIADTAAVIVGILGDVSFDGLVDVRDAILCLRIAAELYIPIRQEEWAADMDATGTVQSADALLILKKDVERLLALKRVFVEREGEIGKALVRLDKPSDILGEVITVPMVVENGRRAWAGDISLSYDPEVLEILGVKASRDGVLMEANTTLKGKVKVCLIHLGGIVGEDGKVIALDVRARRDVQEVKLKLDEVALFDGDAQPIEVVLSGGLAEVSEETIPHAFGLSQNVPNPFNAQTTIGYDLPEAGRVSLRVYNIEGQLVKVLVDGMKEQGHHAVCWDGTDQEGRSVSSGVYLVRMEAHTGVGLGGFVEARKLVLIR